MSGYIFDLDGTLFDSMNIWDGIGPGWLRARGIPVPDDYGAAIFNMSFAQSAAYTVERFALPERPGSLLQAWNDMAARAYSQTVPMKPHAREYLQALYESGAKLAVATSLPAALYLPALERLGIRDLFSVICGAEQVPLPKSEPDAFLFCASQLGLHPRECTVFEDLLVAIQSAKSVGMRTVAVYDAASSRDWPQLQQTADVAILTFEDAPPPSST